MSSTDGQSPAGWYPETEGGRLRYWDGETWGVYADEYGDDSDSMPEGWYEDPEFPWRERWWTGSAWGDDVREADGGLVRLPTSTTEHLVGYVIERSLGVVFGTTVRRANLMATFGMLSDMTSALKGRKLTDALNPVKNPGVKRGMMVGEAGDRAYFAERSRSRAMELLNKRVVELGGNAIVGYRFTESQMGFDTNPSSPLVEVVAYGTAVVARPVDEASG